MQKKMLSLLGSNLTLGSTVRLLIFTFLAYSFSTETIKAQCDWVRTIDAVLGSDYPVQGVSISTGGCAYGNATTNATGYAYFAACGDKDRPDLTYINIRQHHWLEGNYTNSGIFYWYNGTTNNGCLQKVESVYQKFTKLYPYSLSTDPVLGDEVTNRETVKICNITYGFAIDNFHNSNLTTLKNQELTDAYSVRVWIAPHGVELNAVMTTHDLAGLPTEQTYLDLDNLGITLTDGEYYDVRILYYNRVSTGVLSKPIHLRDFEFRFEYHTSFDPVTVESDFFISNSNYSSPGFQVTATAPPGDLVDLTTGVNLLTLDFGDSGYANLDTWGYDLYETDCEAGGFGENYLSISHDYDWEDQSIAVLNFEDQMLMNDWEFNDESLSGKCFRVNFWGENECGIFNSTKYFKVNQVFFKGNDEVGYRTKRDMNNRSSVAPNPSSTKVVLSITSNLNQPAEINIFDSRGISYMKVKRDLILGTTDIQLDISQLSGGVYYIHTTLINSGEILKEKVIKL